MLLYPVAPVVLTIQEVISGPNCALVEVMKINSQKVKIIAEVFSETAVADNQISKIFAHVVPVLRDQVRNEVGLLPGFIKINIQSLAAQQTGLS